MRKFLLSFVAFSILTGSASAQGLVTMLIISAQQKKMAQLQAEAYAQEQRVESQRYKEARDLRDKELRLREQEVEIQRQYLELQRAKHREQGGGEIPSYSAQMTNPPPAPYRPSAYTPPSTPTEEEVTAFDSGENEEAYLGPGNRRGHRPRRGRR